MKFIFLVLILISQLFSSVVKSNIVSLNKDATKATIKIDKIDLGMSGFVYHKLSKNHGSILKNVLVSSFDEKTKIANLTLTNYDALENNALPHGQWNVEVGDEVILAFGYSRGLLIAPNEEIYYRIAKNTNIQWVHPDIFATVLSFNQHPTPLLEDFTKMSIITSTGLVFIYIENRVYTLDAKSFHILNISEVDLHQDSVKLPFYTRIPKISSSWFSWGEGTSQLDKYAPHYYALLLEANSDNKELLAIVGDKYEKLPTKRNIVDRVYDSIADTLDIREYIDLSDVNVSEYFETHDFTDYENYIKTLEK